MDPRRDQGGLDPRELQIRVCDPARGRHEPTADIELTDDEHAALSGAARAFRPVAAV
jgi:hypothetical protein